MAKIVRMEADIPTAQSELDAVGMMVENNRVIQIPKPMISVIETLKRCQLVVIRSACKGVGVAGLIAQPMN